MERKYLAFVSILAFEQFRKIKRLFNKRFPIASQRYLSSRDKFIAVVSVERVVPIATEAEILIAISVKVVILRCNRIFHLAALNRNTKIVFGIDRNVRSISRNIFFFVSLGFYLK